MQGAVFWLVLILLIVFGAMAIAIAMLLTRADRNVRSTGYESSSWRIELWNISNGYRVDLHFVNTCVLGRMSIYQNIVEGHPMEQDCTISREHCMLYEQDGMILIWNMSAVNPAAINGYRLNIPQQIVPGDRLELGNSVFLLTRVERT